MTAHDDRVSLRHMFDHAQEARDLVLGRTRDVLDRDRTVALALTRLLEIVGEAAARVSLPMRSRFPSIPWTRVVGLRNRLIHAYDDVDHDVLWQIVNEDLGTLIAALDQGLDSLDE